MDQSIKSLEAEKAFWMNKSNYSHFSSKYWSGVLKQDNIDINVFKDKIVCEIGCGPFGMIYFLNAKQKIGIDPLINYYKKLNLLQKNRLENLTLYESNGENLQMIADQSVDFVICYNVLDHCQNPDKVISEIHRILKPNGSFYLNCHIIGSLLNLFRKKLKYIDKPHPYHFNQNEIIKMLNKHNLTITHKNKYRIKPALTSLKNILARISMFHFYCICNKY